MYSITESMENQIRKHKRLENSMDLLLDSKKATPYSPGWGSMINNAWMVERGMERFSWRLNRRWIVCLLPLPLLYPRLCSLIPWNRAFDGCSIAVPWPMKKTKQNTCAGTVGNIGLRCVIQSGPILCSVWDWDILWEAKSSNNGGWKAPLLYCPSTHIFWTHHACHFSAALFMLFSVSRALSLPYPFRNSKKWKSVRES